MLRDIIKFYSSGDKVAIHGDRDKLHEILQSSFKNDAGRTSIVEDIVGTQGTIVAVDKEGFEEVLYRKDGTAHTWKIPASAIELVAPPHWYLKYFR